MIGVICDSSLQRIVEEFFQLFKTPWEWYSPQGVYDVVLTSGKIPASHAGQTLIVYGSEPNEFDEAYGLIPASLDGKIEIRAKDFEIPVYGKAVAFTSRQPVVFATKGNHAICVSIPESNSFRMGYDLFNEVERLLRKGQDIEHALSPTLDVHIMLLKSLLVQAGVFIVEIPPVPYGYEMVGCLTHDVDFIRIKDHKFDNSVRGFLFRATAGAIYKTIRGRLRLAHVLQSVWAAMRLPFVHAGLAKDFWNCFDWYRKTERAAKSTWFFSPRKNYPGKEVYAPKAPMRAMRYEIADISDIVNKLVEKGDEIGVHGIDAWHDAAAGRIELQHIAGAAGAAKAGIRMHWLLWREDTYRILEQAGFDYDSTCGYNETPGCKAGTFQPFQPLDCNHLLEIPMHIQDTAMFYPKRMGLKENEALRICSRLVEFCRRLGGGVLTVLWHQRSPGPERLWGDAYVKIIELLKKNDAWFATCAEAANWFRVRRALQFESVVLKEGCVHVLVSGPIGKNAPRFALRLHMPDINRRDGADNGGYITDNGSYIQVCLENEQTAIKYREQLAV